MLEGTPQNVGADMEAGAPSADVLPGLVWRADGNGRLLYANPARLAFTGSLEPRGDSMGWAAAIHPRDGARCIAAYRRALALYRGMGFAEIGSRRAYYRRTSGEAADAVVMRLSLA